ncbi:MAG: alpha/beta hydrolase [Gammaproteobacteria bacterium]
MKKFLLRMLLSIIFITVSVLVLLSAILYFLQPNFVYFPTASLVTTPQLIQLDYEDVSIKTEDSIHLHGWYIPHDTPRATLLFLHGNGGNISHRLESLAIFHELGLSILIIDYRGYGQSEGTPSEHGTYLDAEAAWNYLLNEKKLSGHEIIIFGRSMGGTIATWLASRQQSRAVILESTFTSIADMGKHYYPYLPVSLLTRIKYASIDRISSIPQPSLFIHSPSDDIVPYTLGRKLFDAATGPKTFLEIRGTHNEGFLMSGNTYIDGLDRFITNVIEK